jgi:hypothetical protein
VWISGFIWLVAVGCVTVTGIVASVYFLDCDPLYHGDIGRGDQVRGRE